MTKNKNTRRREVAAPAPFDQARDEMFQHIIRCGVLQAAADHQGEWFDDTIAYLGERYHELTPCRSPSSVRLANGSASHRRRSRQPAKPQPHNSPPATRRTLPSQVGCGGFFLMRRYGTRGPSGSTWSRAARRSPPVLLRRSRLPRRGRRDRALAPPLRPRARAVRANARPGRSAR